jgi:hypothetical protein
VLTAVLELSVLPWWLLRGCMRICGCGGSGVFALIIQQNWHVDEVWPNSACCVFAHLLGNKHDFVKATRVAKTQSHALRWSQMGNLLQRQFVYVLCLGWFLVHLLIGFPTQLVFFRPCPKKLKNIFSENLSTTHKESPYSRRSRRPRVQMDMDMVPHYANAAQEYRDLQAQLLQLAQREKQVRTRMKDMKDQMQEVIASTRDKRLGYDSLWYFAVQPVYQRPKLTDERIKEVIANTLVAQWGESILPEQANLFAERCADVLFLRDRTKEQVGFEIKFRKSRADPNAKGKRGVKRQKVKEEVQEEML